MKTKRRRLDADEARIRKILDTMMGICDEQMMKNNKAIDILATKEISSKGVEKIAKVAKLLFEEFKKCHNFAAAVLPKIKETKNS